MSDNILTDIPEWFMNFVIEKENIDYNDEKIKKCIEHFDEHIRLTLEEERVKFGDDNGK